MKTSILQGSVFDVLPTLEAGSVDWLREKYVSEGMSTYQIARLVGKDPKTVWSWLKKHGIATRARRWDNKASHAVRPYQSAGWLWTEYFFLGRSTVEIAEEFGVWPQTINYFLRRAGIPARSISESRSIKHWGQSGEDNPMFGIRGEAHHNWKGGHTADRQAFYSTVEWREVFQQIWKRDRKRCRRCDVTYRSGARMEIHHIVPFDIKELRSVASNLVLLCCPCHHWVHSKANVNREYIKEA